MNKDQFARLKRHRKVKQILADFPLAVASVPAFAKLAAQYLAQLTLLDGAAQRNSITSEGATRAKTAAGTALIGRLVKAANALYLLYKAQDPANLEEAVKMHRRDSDYANMTDLELATEAVDLNQRMEANKDALMKDYNVSTDDIKALGADATSFNDQLSDPQLAIDAAKIKGATARTTLSGLNVFLRDDLRSGMELLKDTQRDAYDALREASQVDDARYGKVGKAVTRGITSAMLFTSPMPAVTEEMGLKSMAGLQTAASPVPPTAMQLASLAGADVQVAVAATPQNETFVLIKQQGGQAQRVVPDARYHRIGTVPGVFIYQFTFYKRPWTASFEALVGDEHSRETRSSVALGLADGPLTSPDVWDIILTAATDPNHA